MVAFCASIYLLCHFPSLQHVQGNNYIHKSFRRWMSNTGFESSHYSSLWSTRLGISVSCYHNVCCVALRTHWQNVPINLWFGSADQDVCRKHCLGATHGVTETPQSSEILEREKESPAFPFNESFCCFLGLSKVDLHSWKYGKSKSLYELKARS